MDPNLQPGPVMDAFREQIRAVLRVRGFNFCDEGDGSPESNARAVADMRAAAGSVEGRDEVIAAGIEASTVDHQDQCIGVSPQPHAVTAARAADCQAHASSTPFSLPGPPRVQAMLWKDHPRRVHFCYRNRRQRGGSASSSQDVTAAQQASIPLSAAAASQAMHPNLIGCIVPARRQHAAAERGFLVQHRQPGPGLVRIAAVPPGAAAVRAALGHRRRVPRPLPVRVRPVGLGCKLRSHAAHRADNSQSVT